MINFDLIKDVTEEQFQKLGYKSIQLIKMENENPKLLIRLESDEIFSINTDEKINEFFENILLKLEKL